MRILVVGGTGQIGWELRRSLSAFGNVAAPSREELDLASPDSITNAIRAIGPELVVNAAAYTAVDKAESEPALAMKLNGDAPRILAEESAKLGAPLIHYSTDYVFDGEKPSSYREDDSAAPLNEYGRSKLAGERAIPQANPVHLIFRTSWVYGPRGNNFLLTMRRLAATRRELKIVDDQSGAPTSARQIAEATAIVIARLDKERLRAASGIYHLTAAGQTTLHGFAQAILADRGTAAKITGISTADYPTPARRPKNSVLDNSKFRDAFGFVLPDWKVGLGLCLEEIGEQFERR